LGFTDFAFLVIYHTGSPILIWLSYSIWEQRLRVLLKKELKNSDVGSLGRIVLPKVKFVQKSCLFVWFYVVCGSFFVFVGKVEKMEKKKKKSQPLSFI
jgi:hypothetical protein